MNNPRVVAIDFDQTLALYTPGEWEKHYVTKAPINATPNKDVLKAIEHFRRYGMRVIVYSSRSWEDYNTVQTWLIKHNVVVDDVVLGKFKADLYVCDKSVNPNDPLFPEISESILSESK